MKNRSFHCRQCKHDYWPIILAVVATIIAFGAVTPDQASAGPMQGAIFTTTVDGEVVNENTHYNKKEDVYLDGGPGPNAPANAAGLMPGDYYFQVTDPSGKYLLSEDPISCRKIRVNADGVIEYYYPTGTSYEWDNKTKQWLIAECNHETGIDLDHSYLGAITVQLMPYDDTVNKGGVYKVWVTPVERYEGIEFDPSDADKKASINGEYWQPGNFHGFIPSWSKTDNYKVKNPGKDPDPSWIFVKKFHDRNINHVKDEGEEYIQYWTVDITDPLEVQNTYYTPVQYQLLVEGDYNVTEETPDDTMQTVSYLDGATYSEYPEANPTVVVNYDGAEGTEHEVLFGNVGVADPTFCKVYDTNANGLRDEGEVGVPGWKFNLTRLDAYGNILSTEELTAGQDGCASIGGLLPGYYKVEEVIPPAGSWQVTPGSETSFEFQVVSVLEQYETGYKLYGQVVVNGSNYDGNFNFYNVCTGTVGFGTKGFWHNVNGQALISESDIAFINSLDPYMEPSAYFDGGDEPFDDKAEISTFLIENNANADLNGHKEQLAQQLVAFILNIRIQVGGLGSSLWDPWNGVWLNAEGLISEAVAAWNGSDEARIDEIKSLLDKFNNLGDPENPEGGVSYTFETPCPLPEGY